MYSTVCAPPTDPQITLHTINKFTWSSVLHQFSPSYFKHMRPVTRRQNPTLPLPSIQSTPTHHPATKPFHQLPQHTTISLQRVPWFGRAGCLWQVVANFQMLQFCYICDASGLSLLMPAYFCALVAALAAVGGGGGGEC